MTEAEAAVAIVRVRHHQESILLIRRAEREGDPWSGHWSFPGGRREPEDPDLLRTALRELQEECGISLAEGQVETALPPRQARRKAPPFLWVVPFVFRVDARQPVTLDPAEAVEAVWVPLVFLRDPARHVLSPVPGRPPEMLFPAIDLNGVPLWGFTYRLITDWLGLEPEGRLREEAGFQAARLVLDFLLSCGLTLARDWTSGPVRTAALRGGIPVQRVLARFSGRGEHVALVNALEVRPDGVRLAGLAFEEYLIQAGP
ncbi:MAG TPA: CoA pyrophosphatase [Bryobacteraceae bacterium]|nr:CoA pyrophosphatase [Bryobacteraceae bacterium]